MRCTTLRTRRLIVRWTLVVSTIAAAGLYNGTRTVPRQWQPHQALSSRDMHLRDSRRARHLPRAAPHQAPLRQRRGCPRPRQRLVRKQVYVRPDANQIDIMAGLMPSDEKDERDTHRPCLYTWPCTDDGKVYCDKFGRPLRAPSFSDAGEHVCCNTTGSRRT